jgi:2-octaprenylphenol hydroxylase
MMSISDLPSADITVVGAGFVGLGFSLAARQQGFDIRVVDRRSRPEKPLSIGANVIALNRASAKFLESLGVWEKLSGQFVTPYGQMSVFDGEGTGSVTFNAADAGIDHLGHIVDQTALLVALSERAEELELDVQWQTAADIDQCESTLLVAADGAHSKTREALGLRKVGFDYDQRATVCVATLSGHHHNEAMQWFLESGPLAFLPLSEPDKVAVVWSCFEDLAETTESTFLDRLNTASESCLGNVLSITDRFSFPLIAQHALQYVTQGAVLLGDAAHAIHPLAGQGANLGFADADQLVTELCAARIENLGLGDLAVLRRYERKRRMENQLAGAAMEGFHRLFTNKSPLVSLIRSKGMGFVHESSALKRLAINIATGAI